MAGNGGDFFHRAINLNCMVATLAQQFATMTFQMPDQVPPFHASANGSRMTS